MVDQFKRYIQNLPGKSTDRQLLVIESDDWGSIRMPSAAVIQDLQRLGGKPENDPYLKFDSLASESDLQALFEVLTSVNDSQGRPAVLTANSVMANPDFEKIQKNGFEQYLWEPFTETLKRYPSHSGSFDLWREGMDNKIFRPQYHGREHLNVYQWMEGLRSEDYWLSRAFERQMISVSSEPSKMRFGYMEGLDFFSTEEQGNKGEILEQGMEVFRKLFGYTSLSFIANCYIWDFSIEKSLHTMGVKYLQGITNQLVPILDDDGTHRHVYKSHYFGQKNTLGQRYLIRNAFFEPSLDPQFDWVSDCLKRIKIAFHCKKPAIIGSHRLNYIGFIEESNRTKNLAQLKILLKEIVKCWPKVEFIASDELDTIWD
ncbi:MAG: hypothetical protein P8O16_17330 [Algoriphagus sp.]|uniref:hypothetical protein n=1 Tax=Algoriphagus sp. TaxID=1872435 RepID=UPI00260F004C|nr:hypothetical protein [Algoriphagus sp.]MDG1279045.1 hypothetical protein [Algoriphagus sp.]